MKQKRLKTSRKILMPTFTRRLNSFKLQEVSVKDPHLFHLGMLGYAYQAIRLAHLIDGAAKESKIKVRG